MTIRPRFLPGLLTLLLAFLSPCLLHAQGWGKVDTRLLLILHPKMALFDYSAGRFYRQAALQRDQEKLRKEMADAWEKAQPTIRSIMVKQSRVIRSRAELVQRWGETMNSLAEHAASETQSNRDYHKVGTQYDQRYQDQMAALDQELRKIADELTAAREEAYAPVFLRTTETMAQLAEIKQELMALLSQAAGELRITTVLDTSYAAPAVTPAPDLAAIPTQQDTFDLFSSTLFQSITNWDDKLPSGQVPMADGSTTDYATHVVPRLKAGVMDNLRQYLDYRSYLARHLATMPSPGGIFLLGGIDLTPVVARKLFEKYRIPDDLKNAFMYVIRDYGNVEQPGVPDAPTPTGPPAAR